MFEALRTLIADLAHEDAANRGFAENDYRVAAVALLVHVADIDGEIDLSERRRIKGLVAERFGLDQTMTSRLIATAERADRESVDLYHFTSLLMRALDLSGRRKVIKMMWDIAYADGKVGEFEENVVWRVAELLGISSRDRILLRQEVAAERGGAGEARRADNEEFVGPWSAVNPAPQR